MTIIMDDDIYAYIGIRAPNGGNKRPASGRIESLIDRGTASSAKINSLKIKQKAKELKEMRSIPIINEKSRKIAEAMKRERLDVMAKYEAKIAPPPEPEVAPPVKVSVDILRSLELVEKPPQEPDLKSMNIHERTKYWQDQKAKKIEEQRKMKKDKELEGCTFKPKKVDKQDFEISSKPGVEAEVKAAMGKAQKKEGLRAVASQGKLVDDFDADCLAVMLKGKDFGKANGQAKREEAITTKPVKKDGYRPLAPEVQEVRVKPGFLSEIGKSRFK